MSIYGRDIITEASFKITNSNDNKIKSVTGFYNDGVYNSLVRISGAYEYMRARSEILVLSEDFNSLFIQLNQDGTYKIPGGTWEKDEDHMTAAIRECKEEAKIVPKNVMYFGSYVYRNNRVSDWVKKNVEKQYQWKASYVEVYCGIKDRLYSGIVNDKDKDDISWKGQFVPIDKISDKLFPIHLKAIRVYTEWMYKNGSNFRSN